MQPDSWTLSMPRLNHRDGINSSPHLKPNVNTSLVLFRVLEGSKRSGSILSTLQPDEAESKTKQTKEINVNHIISGY